MGNPKLTDLSGVGESKAKALMEHDYMTIEDIANASIESLCQVPGIKQATAIKLQEDALVLLHSLKPSNDEAEEKVVDPENNSEDQPMTEQVKNQPEKTKKDKKGKKGKKSKKDKKSKKEKKSKRDKKSKKDKS